MLCLLKLRLPLSFTDINDAGIWCRWFVTKVITFLLLAITENSPETFPLRTQKKERIKYTSHQLHELKAAFKINQYPSVSGKEHLARKIGVTESQIQVHNSVLLQHIFDCANISGVWSLSQDLLTYCLLDLGSGSQTKERSTKLEGTRLMKQDQEQTTQKTSHQE